MKFDAVISGGLLLDPENGIRKVADIAIKDGKIAEIGENLQADTRYDASGKLVMPGVIDMHVHVTNTLGGRVGYYMAANTGVSTIIDYAGPISDITDHLNELGCGLNVGCLNSALPHVLGANPTHEEMNRFVDESLQGGALGLKILGGHFPLTPDASRCCIEACNERKVFVAWHAGSTENRSDIYGMREVIDCAKGNQLLLAHINAYCRGNRYNYLEELRDAFEMLRENPNIISDSHMAVDNGTSGICKGNEVLDHITQNCLRTYGYEVSTDGLEKAIREGTTKVIAPVGHENVLLEREAALAHWQRGTAKCFVSFPVNLPQVAAACLLERKPNSREFLIDLAATDGGGIPRNGLLHRLLCYHKLGYLTLEEVIYKCSTAPARVFALRGKGHLGIGADADIAVVDLDIAKPVFTTAMGRPVYRDGKVVGTRGTLLATERGEAVCKEKQLTYQLVDPMDSWFYEKR